MGFRQPPAGTQRMTTHKNFITILLISLVLGVAGSAVAQSAGGKVTLDQAVKQVQQDTGGKVLSAEQRAVGRRQEYRIKVLTPQGHVKVVVVSSDREVADGVRRHGAYPLGADSLLRRLSRS